MFSSKKQVEEDIWVTSCIDQCIVLPSWSKVESKACSIIKRNLEKGDLNSSQWAAAMQLLGKENAEKHFSSSIEADYSDVDDKKRKGKEKKKTKKTTDVKHTMISILEAAAEKSSNKGKNKFHEYSTFTYEAKRILRDNLESSHKKSKSKKGKKSKYFSEGLWHQVLSYDPSLVKLFCINLQKASALIPGNVRLAVWCECLLAKEKSRTQGVENFQKTKKKLMHLSSRGSLDESWNHSDGFNDISTHAEKGMKDALCFNYSDESFREFIRMLKLYSMFSKKMNSQLVFWSMPIYFANSSNKSRNLDEDEDEEEDDDRCTAVAVVDKTIKNCLLKKEVLFSLASKTMDLVKEDDQDLSSHIQKAAGVDVPAVINDFPSSILDSGMDSLEQRTVEDKSTKRKINPDIFVRKWLHEGFVTILSENALYFAWDQMFLNGWTTHSLQTLCLVIIGLLKPWFMIAKNYTEIRHVFLKEPYKLYTRDIQCAWCHMQKKGKVKDLASMNRNIKGSGTPLPLAAPTPPPPSPPKPSLPPPPPKAFIPWVPYEKTQTKSQMPAKTKVDLPFDLYIDAVRFVPDNATVTKVSAKILNMYIGKKDNTVKMEAYPVMDSMWRFPSFIFKQSVNREGLPMNPDVVIMFRLYAIEKHTKKVMVLGSCLFCPFSNKHGKQAMLRVGGHQIRFRHGIPDPDFTIQHMLASHMDDNPIIPGLTILIRVMPHEKDFAPAPEYESHVYRSDLCKPNESEERLYKYYQGSDDFNVSFRDVAMKCCGLAAVNDDNLQQSIKLLFDKGGRESEDFAYERYVGYQKTNGVMVLADKATGLPIFLEGRYLQCLVQFFPGEDSKLGNGNSQVISFVTEDLDLESTQRAPDWTDIAKKINPDYDDRAYLLVSLYGLKPHYDPDTGKLTDKDGKEPRIELKNSIAWSILPCFDKNSVFAGSHIVPLMKGQPPDSVKEKLGYLPFDYICKKFSTSIKFYDTASIEISIWDGIFSSDQCPPLPTHTSYLNVSPNPKKFLMARKQNYGPTVAELLKNGLSKTARLSDHEDKIIELLQEIFKENLNRALNNAGYNTLL